MVQEFSSHRYAKEADSSDDDTIPQARQIASTSIAIETSRMAGESRRKYRKDMIGGQAYLSSDRVVVYSKPL